jgi:hypothetical protein
MVAVLFDAVVAAPVPPTGVDLVDVVTDGQLRTWVEVTWSPLARRGTAASARCSPGGP